MTNYAKKYRHKRIYKIEDLMQPVLVRTKDRGRLQAVGIVVFFDNYERSAWVVFEPECDLKKIHKCKKYKIKYDRLARINKTTYATIKRNIKQEQTHKDGTYTIADRVRKAR